MPVHYSAEMHLGPTNLSLSTVHPGAVRFNEGLVNQEMLPGLLPLSVGSRLFPCIVCVDTKLQDSIFAHNLVERIATVSLELHGYHHSPVFIITK